MIHQSQISSIHVSLEPSLRVVRVQRREAARSWIKRSAIFQTSKSKENVSTQVDRALRIASDAVGTTVHSPRVQARRRLGVYTRLAVNVLRDIGLYSSLELQSSYLVDQLDRTVGSSRYSQQ